jgi:hypothetical protein
MLVAKRAVLLELDPLRMLALVLVSIVVPSLAFTASQYNLITRHNLYLSKNPDVTQ